MAASLVHAALLTQARAEPEKIPEPLHPGRPADVPDPAQRSQTLTRPVSQSVPEVPEGQA